MAYPPILCNPGLSRAYTEKRKYVLSKLQEKIYVSGQRCGVGVDRHSLCLYIKFRSVQRDQPIGENAHVTVEVERLGDRFIFEQGRGLDPHHNRSPAIALGKPLNSIYATSRFTASVQRFLL